MICDTCKQDIYYNEAIVTFPPRPDERDQRHEHLSCYLTRVGYEKKRDA